MTGWVLGRFVSKIACLGEYIYYVYIFREFLK